MVKPYGKCTVGIFNQTIKILHSLHFLVWYHFSAHHTSINGSYQKIQVKEVGRAVIASTTFSGLSCTLYGTKHNIRSILNLNMNLLMT